MSPQSCCTLLTNCIDEPEEVEVVEQQLTEHLDMDPNVTLGVLCDQIVPPEEPMDEEDQAIRDRLRSLVLGFMVGRAKRAIVERHAQPAEAVLVDGLVKVRGRLVLRSRRSYLVFNLFLDYVQVAAHGHRYHCKRYIVIFALFWSLLSAGKRFTGVHSYRGEDFPQVRTINRWRALSINEDSILPL